ncbi:MAG: sensor histidine kinase, partial [Clostridia bacterium]|nr:sensor histidine kinase [Clostridia bacterium]
MRFLSNPEIKKFLTATVVISLVLCGIAFFYSTATGVFTLGVALFLMVSFLIFTKQRYNRINSLAENIDRILHGNDTLSIQSYGEGELAILECDVQKMLVRLRDQKDQLEKEKTFLSDSIADISHQLRTPLTSIRLLLSLLQSSDLTDARRSALLGELSTLIVKTETLVSMLLKISKIDTGTVQFE